MIRRTVVALPCVILCVSTVPGEPTSRADGAARVRQLIRAQIDQSTEATRLKDIDRTMSVVPEDRVIHDEKGGTLTRDDLRRDQREQ